VKDLKPYTVCEVLVFYPNN